MIRSHRDPSSDQSLNARNWLQAKRCCLHGLCAWWSVPVGQLFIATAGLEQPGAKAKWHLYSSEVWLALTSKTALLFVMKVRSKGRVCPHKSQYYEIWQTVLSCESHTC